MAVRRPVVFASVLLSVALSVSACASDTPPAAAPSSGAAAPVASSTPASPTTTTSAPPTTTPPVDPVLARIPRDARVNNQEGAEAFAKFFFDQVVASFVTADPTLLNGLYAKSCKTCIAFSNTANGFKEQGRRQEKASFLVDRVAIRRFLDDERVKMVEIRGKQVVVDIVDKTGQQVGKTKPGDVTFILSLEWNDRWVAVAAVVER